MVSLSQAMPGHQQPTPRRTRPTALRGLVLGVVAVLTVSRGVQQALFVSLAPTRLPSTRSSSGALPQRMVRMRSAEEEVTMTEAPVFICDQDAVTGEPDISALPAEMGVYAVFDEESKLQYVGLTRQLDKSMTTHVKSLGATDAGRLIRTVHFLEMPDKSKEELKAVWQMWISTHMQSGGDVPPGNLPDNVDGCDSRWRSAGKANTKEPLKLAGARGLADMSDAKEAIDGAVKKHPIVLFMKGTPIMPQCGFSARATAMLKELDMEYESVNVMDDVANPYIRDAVKEYSGWPTIPQLFVKGTLVGGTDIMTELYQNGQLRLQLSDALEGTKADSEEKVGSTDDSGAAQEYMKGDIELIDDKSRPVASLLSKLLKDEFDLYGLRIIDETAQHDGDPQALAMGLTSESHFRVEVVAPEFEGLSPVERQRKVFDSLGDTMQKIHALSLVTRTPAEVSA